MRMYSFIFLICLSLCSCVEKKTPLSRVEYERVESDSGFSYIRRTFNRMNNLKVEEQLGPDSVNQGYYKSYYRNSSINSEGTFENGLKHGSWSHHDTTGGLTTKQSWFGGKQFGEQVIYDSSGRIKAFYFMNIDGAEVGQIHFKDGRIMSNKGMPLYLAFTSDSINCNDRYEILIFFGVPQHMNYDILIREHLSATKRLISEKSYSSADEVESVPWGKRIVVSKVYDKSSTYEWEVKFKLYDENGVIREVHEQLKVFVRKS